MQIEILQHNIDYNFLENDKIEIDECNIDHIKQMIIEGYNQGELCQYNIHIDSDYRGWWKIDNN